ncbi:hypothetical protein [Paractinoplanes atraurantiacus]|uniref:Uncharacterized protein n=1 Tax=Paractinoplanes atraurantiacus TaxID=1036182 RepID=A0A285F4F5_9ACTN|nr:hypothetical protein [Actinoplanes atraurantiacus]SNY06179.1 hypothetical protein SAMN05421748_101642 [Actinoplanes atraurantiacus]
MPEAPVDDPGLLAGAATTLRLIIGWAFTALALLNLAMGLDSFAYGLFHGVLLLAGLTLLGLQRVGRRPGRTAWVAGAAVAVLGLVISTLPQSQVNCCSSEYGVRHGFPFTMWARDPGGWHADGARIAVALLFWALIGMLVLIAVARLTPSRPSSAAPGRPSSAAPGRPSSAATAPPSKAGNHAEERGTRTADDENVRGLP